MATTVLDISNDKRKVVASANTSSSPYFEKVSDWSNIGGSIEPRARISEGETLFYISAQQLRQASPACVLGKYVNVGIILNVEIPPGSYLAPWAFGTPAPNQPRIYKSGRYAIVLDMSTFSVGANVGCDAFLADTDDRIRITEWLTFNASEYEYTDFLQSPNAILQYEGKDTRATISRILPRLGFVDSVLNELVTGRWLGNQLRYSEDLSQTTYWRGGGVTVTTNATTAPDGTNTADKIASAATGRVYQDAPVSDNLSPGNKTFSVWVKSVSGNTPFKLRVKEAFGETVNELDQICGLSWNRFFLTGEVTTKGCTAEIEVSNINGIYVWGMQVVDTDSEPGAYTKTTSAILPPGTKPSGAPTFDIPNIEGRVGDRLENLSWDGKFATPIAWICTAPGNPGTWKEVYLFDAYNASQDPYFYSSLLWELAYDTGTSAIVVDNGLITISGCDQNQSFYFASVNTVKCIVAYELVTVEWNMTFRTGIDNAQANIRLGYDPAGTNLYGQVPTGVAGPGSADLTLSASATSPQKIGYTAYCAYGVGSVKFSKLSVRPKYPFLTKAPSNFTALPELKSRNQALVAPKDVWYSNDTAAPTYAAGALTFDVAGKCIWQPIVTVPGKTYRIRVNFATVNAGAIPALSTTSGSGQVNLTAATGIQEATFTGIAGTVALQFLNANGATGGFSINYIRLYSE